MRARGARRRVYFDLNFNEADRHADEAGRPVDVDPPRRRRASSRSPSQQTGCPTPVIVLNELSGASARRRRGRTTTRSTARTCSRFVQDLAALGAHPVLLVAKPPYTGGDAIAWWQQVAQVAELVREVYVPATRRGSSGRSSATATCARRYRQAVADFTSIGIPANRVGLMVSFATTKGFGGRNGLEPASAWYQVAKWQALAVQQVAAETGIASVWSWGWGEWNATEQDPDKPYAACAWLWARSPALCDAPQTIGKGFDRRCTEGQLSLLAPGRSASSRSTALSTRRAIGSLQALTGDRETRVQRAVRAARRVGGAAGVDGAPCSRRERAVIRERSAAAAAPTSRAATGARDAPGRARDPRRRAAPRAARGSRGPPPTPSARRGPDVLHVVSGSAVRLVRRTPSPSWLGSKAQGYALSEVAPDRLFALPRREEVPIVSTRARRRSP